MIALKNDEGFYATKDHGFFDSHGKLILLGRADERLVQLGEKLYPHHIETSLRQYFPFKSLIVTSVYKQQHQIIIAFSEPIPSTAELETLKQKVGSLFFPKYFFPLDLKSEGPKILLKDLKDRANKEINSL